MSVKFLKLFKKDLLFQKIDQKFKSLFPDTFIGQQIYFNLSKIFNYYSYNKRKSIFKEKFSNIPDGLSILDYEGYKINKLGDDFSKEILNKINLKKIIDPNLNFKKDFLKNYPIDILSKDFAGLKKLIISHDFIAPIINYLGSVPLLWTCEVWVSPNKSFETGRSQEFHLDGEDIRQVKCFIPLEDITEDSGPLNIINAENTKNIFNKLHNAKKINFRHQKVSDEDMYKVTSKKNTVTLLAKKGDVIMLDTSRCYHYGSRPGKKIRKLLFLQFFSINSKKLSIFQNFHNNKYDNIEGNIFLFQKLKHNTTN